MCKLELLKYLQELQDNSINNMVENPTSFDDFNLNDQEEAIQNTILLIENFIKKDK